MCVLICVLSRVCSHVCSLIWALIHVGVLSYVCSHMYALICCALMCSHISAPLYSYLYIIVIIFPIFIIICSALAWQCFQRMTWSFRSSTGSIRTPSMLTQSTSTQTEPSDEIKNIRKHMELQHHRINMLTQQIGEKDDQITDLQEWVSYYQGDLATPPLWVSRAGARFHVCQDCNSLRNANPNGVRRLTLCTHCIHHLHASQADG